MTKRRTRMKQDLLGLPVYCQMTKDRVLEEVLKATAGHRNVNFTFINPYSYHVAKSIPSYSQDLRFFDGVMVDGIGVVLAGRLLGLKIEERISFDSTSLAPEIFKLCSDRQLGIYLVGGHEGVADRARDAICGVHHSLEVVGTHPGYFESENEVFEKIRNSAAKVVVVGMGTPLQEAFLVSLKKTGWLGAGFTCGGYLDQVAKRFDYYPRWIDRLNLRFLYRLVREPKRLWRRYLIEYQTFVMLFAKAYCKRLGSRLGIRKAC